MQIFTLIVIALLCLFFTETRNFSLVLFALLFLAYPLTFIAMLAVLIYFIHQP